jgi:phosphate uptake regulator
MKRKIIKQGHNTLTITLPSSWTKKFNLKAGKEVDLFEKENGLFITTERVDEGKRAEFSIIGLDIPIIWKYLMSIYREGYDEVKIRFKPESFMESPYKFFSHHKLDLTYGREKIKKPVLEALQGFVDRFIGYEIIEQEKDYIIVREMGQITSREFDNSLRRVFLLIHQMAEETLEAIKINDAKVLQHIHDVDINLDKFHDYCIRILNKIGNKETRKVSLLFSTLYLLELVGDEFKNISNHLLEDFSKTKKMKNILPLAEAIKEQIDAYYDLFYKFDEKKIKKLSELDSEMYLKVPSMYDKASEKEKEIYHHLRIISRYINALFELRIEMEY